MNNELIRTGTITEIKEPNKGISNGKKWINQDFIIDTKEEYNNILCFNIFGQEKIDNLSKYNKVGDTVTVKFNVDCREYNGRYFTNLKAWRIDKVESSVIESLQQVSNENKEGDNDLPW